ncbi:MAG TPA: ferrous iron transport protein B [Methanotrichaceae archaeon]|nr:ferrous iron transport protein B [Methanotrichaceae archaeon]
MQTCHSCPSTGICKKSPSQSKSIDRSANLTVALAGNANVGKSAVFNQLTGVDQIIGNWPGKTVERAEGMLQYKGQKIRVIDLPGIYSFSTFSMEELVSREFIALEKPDIVVNVVDASALERNLFFAIQLLELKVPVIIALNQIDLMEKKGISIDYETLGEILGVPVVPTVAIKGKGISLLTEEIVQLALERKIPPEVKYGKEVEQRIEKLTSLLDGIEIDYPRRWVAIKLLEKDEEITKLVEGIDGIDGTILRTAGKLAKELEKIHGETSSVIISAERYHVADEIARIVQKVRTEGQTLTDRLDSVALHPVLGYFAIIGVIGGLLVWTFIIGTKISELLVSALSSIEQVEPVVSGPLADIFWNGAFAGFVAGVTLVIPYVLPFYIILAVIEDSGYLTRISVMLDRGMHKLGLHGKAIIPLILGYGCNVPACFSCRIMETPKQKYVAAFLVSLVPCTARTVVILGLVAAFVNIWWALALYVFDIVLIILLGRIAFKVVPGESVGLIMEMPSYHVPSAKVVLKQTWARTKSLLWIVFPAYIIGSAVLQAVYAAGWLNPINDALSVITVGWLGLPAAVGILLIFGVVRKELTILMLAVIFQTTDFASVMSSVQLIVLALVTMIYIPCLAVILCLTQEFGWKKASAITVFEVVFAILLGGIAFRLLSLFM